jgi:inosine-uridine nucleoside N-ribohydrolase
VRVHLDTDIGGDMDDLCALAYLLRSPDAELVGVTTVVDHGGRRAGFVCYALALAGRDDVPVAAGADVSRGGLRWGAPLPPAERYWPEPVPPLPGSLDAALDLLERNIEDGATVIAIGPFTNLALLERQHPGILRQAKLYLMGGHVRPAPAGFPAWDFSMDYNVQEDAEAAKLVLASSNPTMVPIEVTAQTALRRADLPALRESWPLGALIARQAEAFAVHERNEERYGQTCPALPRDFVNFQHDPLAVAVALGWDGVRVEQLPLTQRMQHGWLRMEEQPGGRRTAIVTEVDGRRFDEHWLRRVAGG